MDLDHRDLIFYDGRCGLCHRLVRRVVGDPAGERFGVAPLQGQTIRRVFSEAQRAALPDAMVVRTAAGVVLTRSDAVLYVLDRLSDRERRCAKRLRLVPRPLREVGYRAIAAVRHWFFKRPQALCPLMTPEQQRRVLP